MLVGVGVTLWLLLAYTGGDAGANRVQLEAIRTAATISVGVGGLAALLLAARRQQSTEIALKQKDRDQADSAQVAAITAADAEARRITELYTRAVEQLGSEKAPVRLGGLYALERLAQDHPEQRQTIVNVWCAYLRMPFTPPSTSPRRLGTRRPPRSRQASGVSPQPSAPGPAGAGAGAREELEVRLTAQRIVAQHLDPGPEPTIPVDTFWEEIDLDLTGATLVDWKLYGCRARNAAFGGALFIGDAVFTGARFAGDVAFDKARFTKAGGFAGVRFGGDASFSDAQFAGVAYFERAKFGGDAWFDGATFTYMATFAEAQFTGDAHFFKAQFIRTGGFTEAQFAGNAGFLDAQFGRAFFDGARFAQGMPDEVAAFHPTP